MRKKKDHDKSFWVSYSDLMTSLFFVALVLFAIEAYKLAKVDPGKMTEQINELSAENVKLKNEVSRLGKENTKLTGDLQEAEITIEEQKKYISIKDQFKPLIESDKFIYLPNSQKYVAKDFLGVEIFDPDESAIKAEYRAKTIEIGREVEGLLKRLHTANPSFSYLLIIEGNAANTYDKKYSKDSNYGYTLGYGRALAVYQHWRRAGISLRKYNAEVLICGSGFNGIDRDKKEENNERFSIQIIPKIKSPEN